MSGTRQVAFRLKSEGKAELIRDAGEVKAALVGAYDGAEAAAARAGQASDRQQERYARMATAAKDAEAAARRQATINELLGVGDSARAQSARRSAEFFEQELAAMEKQEASARRLKAILDPLGAAQDRLNDELMEYKTLADRGAISAKELAEAQALARTRFDETTRAIERQGKGLTGRAANARLNLARQAGDVFTTASMGMNPGMIAIQQGPQILEALGDAGFKATPGLVAAGGAVAAVAASVGLLGAAWLRAEDIANDYERAVTGIGRTANMSAHELQILVETSAAQAEVTTGAAREQAAAYLATGRIGGEVIGGLIRIGKDYAAMMGVDAKEATQQLAHAFTDPDKAARDLTRTMGLLDQKTLDHIDALVKQGDLLGAQKILMDALSTAVEGQAEKTGALARAWDGVTRSISGAIDKAVAYFEITPRERLQTLINQRARIERGANGRALDARTQGLYDTAGREAVEIQQQLAADEARRKQRASQAQANQAAQLREDREDRDRPRRDRGGDEAERKAREALQRQRREEDGQAERERQIAVALGDREHLRALDLERDLRQRIRQLIDDGVSAEAARTQALQEQRPLIEAQARQRDRAGAQLTERARMEALAVASAERELAMRTRSADVQARIRDYQDAGYDVVTALLRATQDQLAVDEARAKVMERITREAQAEEQLRLAQLRGDDRETRRLSVEQRIQQRARDIEGRGKLNYGEGVDQAQSEIQAELDAEAVGARRTWLKGFIADIRRGGIREAMAEQLEKAGDRMIDRMIDALMEVDWARLMNGGGDGKGNGLSDFVSTAFNAFFGSDGGFGGSGSSGGAKASGLSVADLMPSPSKASGAGSMKALKSAASAPAAVIHEHYYLQGAVTTDELWRRIDRGDRKAASDGATAGAQTAVGIVRRSGPAEQRTMQKLKG